MDARAERLFGLAAAVARGATGPGFVPFPNRVTPRIPWTALSGFGQSMLTDDEGPAPWDGGWTQAPYLSPPPLVTAEDAAARGADSGSGGKVSVIIKDPGAGGSYRTISASNSPSLPGFMDFLNPVLPRSPGSVFLRPAAAPTGLGTAMTVALVAGGVAVVAAIAYALKK